MLIQNAKLAFPFIYEADDVSRFDQAATMPKLRYGTNFTVLDMPDHNALIDAGVIEKEKADGSDRYFTAKSMRRPSLTLRRNTLSAYKELAETFAVADVRNIGRDALLIDLTVSMEVYTYNYKFQGAQGVGISILKLFLSDDNLAIMRDRVFTINT